MKDYMLNEVYSSENQRLKEFGLDVIVVKKETHNYIITGELNSDDLELFLSGDFGYIISACYS